ncbi:MAG: DedA family protein [Rhodospirillaceae bacterium]|nr:DedA family protein [Rhodospirillaceae bacterium]
MLLILVSVFCTAFLAATILPFSSELVVATAMADERVHLVALWASATAGNTLGAVVNYWLGRGATRYQDKQWFPASQTQMDKAEAWFNRYGIWSLLLTWIPIGGDALTVIAGLLRIRLDIFVIFVGLGKGARYAVVIAGLDALLF